MSIINFILPNGKALCIKAQLSSSTSRDLMVSLWAKIQEDNPTEDSFMTLAGHLQIKINNSL